MRLNTLPSRFFLLPPFLAMLMAGAFSPPVFADSVVELGGEVRDMVADATGSRLYFTLDTDEIVTVNMGATSVAARVTVAGDPGPLALSPDGSRLYVGLRDTFEIAVYTAPGLAYVESFLTTSTHGPSGLAAGPGRLYVTRFDFFSIFDTSTGDEIYTDWLADPAMRMQLLSDNTTLVGVTVGGSPNHLYQFDVSNDTLEKIGEGCCHSCTGGSLGQYQISADETRVYLAAGTPYHAQVLNLPESGLSFRIHNILTGPYPRCLALSPSEDTVYVGYGGREFVVVSTQDWLPHSVIPLEEYSTKNGMVLSPGGDMLAVVTGSSHSPTQVEFVTVTAPVANRGGVKLRPVDSIDGLPIPNINGWLVLGEGAAAFIDTENGIFANAPLEGGSYTEDLGAPGYDSVTLNFDIVSGQWTDLGDVPMTRTGDLYGPYTICATPAAISNETTTLTLHGQYFEPGVVLDTVIPEFSIVDYTWLSPYKIEVTVTVGHYDDPYREYNAIRVTNPSSVVQNFGTVFVIPGGIASLELTEPAVSIAEFDGPLTLEVTRTGAIAGEVTVDYQTVAATATAGADYTATSGTLTWLDGDADPKTISVPISSDTEPEGPETFTVELLNPTGGAVLGAIAATEVTIEDDDSSTVRFAVATTGVNETDGTVSLTVSRGGDISAAGSVVWATTDGTAVTGEDYTGDGGTLNWAAGNGDDKTINVAILNDSLFEDPESFTVVLSSPGGNAFLGEPSTATVTITSDDVIEIVLSAGTYSANEGDGTATITAWRIGATNGAVTADYATADGTAVAGSDYTTATGILTWIDGDTDPKTFPVPILDDAAVELDETVLLSLSNPTGGATIGTTSTAELTIEDNDGSLLRFTTASFNVDEAGGSVDITVERFGSDTSGAVGVDFATSDGTAIAGLDYVANSGTLSWADGESADQTFSVTILDDSLLEGPESLSLSLSNPTGNAALGTPAGADLTIGDDDGGEIPINTETSGPQTRPDVAMAPDGRSVVVWESYLQDGAGWGIFGQRFDADGAPAGSEFLVNSTTAGDQRYAAVAMAPDGAFTVVWGGSDASGDGIRGRRFNADGAALGADFIVNTTTNGDQNEPDVATDGSGATLVVWQSDHTGDLEIRGRSFDPSGSATGNEFAVNTTTANDQQLPSVASSSGGGFVAAWQSYGQDGPAEGIIARRFASSGSPLGAEVVVNEWTSGNQVSPDVGQAADGSFFVAWEDTTHQDGMGSSIRARRFSSAAAPLGGDFQLNTYWIDDQTQPKVTSDSAGVVTVAWESEDQDGSDLGIYSRTMDGSGVFISPEIRFNSFITGIQNRPAVARVDTGAYWVVWSSGGQDGSGDGIYGVFGAAPVVVNIFTDGFESGDDSAWSSGTP